MRSRAGFKVESQPALEVMVGDLMDPAFVASCVEKKHGVFSCLGYRPSGWAPWNGPLDGGYLTTVADNICQAMKTHKVDKALVVSAAGVGESAKFVPWWVNVSF
jgi:hypothetical protein